MVDAAVLIIGNEILSGRCEDANGPFLIRRLRSLGLDLTRMVVLPDDVEAIAEEVRRINSRHTWIFTAGGVGPTHDDVTFQGIARGLGIPLEERPEIVKVLESRMGTPLGTAALRMARIPQGADLRWEGNIAYPLVTVRNIVILPGVPDLLRAKFDAASWRFTGQPVLVEQLECRDRETRIAHHLMEAAERFPEVTIGSYPRWEGRDARVSITLESRVPEALQNCAKILRERLAESLEDQEQPLGPSNP